jgi:hypothetical protein
MGLDSGNFLVEGRYDEVYSTVFEVLEGLEFIGGRESHLELY